jgi:hypothetical protein
LKDKKLYDIFEVGIRFRDRVYGGIPKSKELIELYIKSKFGEENMDLADKVKKEMDVKETLDLEEQMEKVTTGFRVKNKSPHLADYQIKAMIKQCATRLRITTKKRGSKNDITDGMFVTKRIFFYGQNEKKIEGPLEVEDFCGHVMTRQGKRSILKSSEYVEKAYAIFTIRVIKNAVLSEKNLKEMLLLGQEIGLGSNRSFEKGKFDLLSFKKAA